MSLVHSGERGNFEVAELFGVGSLHRLPRHRTPADRGLSLVTPLALPDDAATQAVLVAAHLVAASIIIPILGQGLTTAAAKRAIRVR